MFSRFFQKASRTQAAQQILNTAKSLTKDKQFTDALDKLKELKAYPEASKAVMSQRAHIMEAMQAEHRAGHSPTPVK